MQEKKEGPLLHSFTLASSQSPCCSGTPNMPAENGKLPQTHRGKDMDRGNRGLKWFLMSKPCGTNSTPPLSLLHGLP